LLALALLSLLSAILLTQTRGGILALAGGLVVGFMARPPAARPGAGGGFFAAAMVVFANPESETRFSRGPSG
jgi:hypothetical protein